VIYEPKV